MNKRIIKFLFIVLVISLSSIACNLGKFESNEMFGEEYSSEEGGFSIQKVKDYTFADVLGGIEMTAPDAEPQVGPGLQIFGSLTDQDQTNEEMWDIITQPGNTYFDFDKPDKYKVDGARGLLAEFDGEQNGVEVRGKVFLVMVKPDQQFIMFGVAPKEDWKDFEPVYMKVLDSVKFFDAIPIDTSFEEYEEPEFEEGELGQESAPVAPVIEEPQIMRQWASFALASTEYSSTDWSAMQATGAPDVDNCGSNPKAWSPAYIDTEEYIEVFYDIPVIPTELVIYQSYNPSQVVEIQLVDPDGEAWMLWYGEPESVSSCPDMWTHTIELDEPFLVKSVVIFVDLGWLDVGGVEIDAVELVGYPEGAQPNEQAQTEQDQASEHVQSSSNTMDENVPANYTGLMAGPVYQGWLNVIINETKEADLDKIMTITGKKSTENWKPRPDHKDTYLYQMPWDGMIGYISVTTDGLVYKKSINPNYYPNDYVLDTVNQDTYDQLNAIYNRDKVIPYAVMANLLGSPGFLIEQRYRVDDNMLISQYIWLDGKGGRISGYFLNGNLTGMAGLAYIQE